ncbi:methionine adenosyltransferase 2 subunit beta isoform X3 [Oncorhynchus mykiss]|uniref:methionine adenosyltransferase 2 subunit beta isoform X3 n=1 Tax=Oncorhynchus mykiss TaxID=8022 RepID=UPI000B4F84AB|nr:methionine adenosyltransferase 2 subunit beta isoform X3 [Oncorhynchus mykiss]
MNEKELKIHFTPGHVEVVQENVAIPYRRVLVTGATGLLGRAVYKEFQNNAWHALGCGYRRAQPRFLRCNLTDEDAVRAVIQDFQPHVIVHCAAERRPDVVEQHTEAALNLNVHASGTLAKEAGAAVLRVPILYGEVERVDESAVTVLWDKVQEGAESCSVEHCQQRFPTYVNDVARVCRQMAERRLQDPSIRGIFHYSGKEQMTKYEMACVIADAFNLSSSHLIPMTEQPAGAGAQRPQNARLECSRLELLGLGVEPIPFKTAVRDSLWPFLYDKRWRQTVFH